MVEKDIWPITNLPTALKKYSINSTAANQQVNTLCDNGSISVKNISACKISLQVQKLNSYTIRIFDAQGRLCDFITARLNAGIHDISRKGDYLSGRVLFVQINFEDKNTVTRLIKPF